MMSAETLPGDGNQLIGCLFDTTGKYQSAIKVIGICSM
jgi:hypothetical protein